MRVAASIMLLGVVLAVHAEEKKPRLDVHGDNLPDGAIARLGSARLRHGEAVSFTAFLPDGKTLVSTGADWNIRLWDVANGKELKQFSHVEDADNRRVPLRRPGRNSPLLACLSADGKVMATCAVNGRSVQVWDLPAGKTVKTITPGTQSVNAIAISPDGKTLAVSMSDASIRIIETATGKELRSVGRENQPMGGFSFSGGFSGLRFSPDNKTLVLMGMEFDNGMLKRSLRAWDATTGKMLYRTEADAQRTLFGSTPSFSPDGKQFVLSTYQGDLHLVEATTGKEGRVIKSGMGRIDSVIFSHDGKQVIARGMNDSGLGIWDASNGKEVKVVGKAVQPGGVIRPRFSSYSGITGGMSLSPDGKRIATPDGNQVRLIDLSNGKDVFTSSGHRGAINSLRFLGDGKTLLSQSLDGSLRLWDPTTGKQTGEVKVPDNAYTFHLSNDAKFMAVEGTDGATRVINVETGKELYKLPQAQPMRLAMFAFSPDNSRLAMRSRTESVTRIFSVATGIELATLGKPNPMDQPFRTSMRSSAMAFSPDGTLLAAPGDETGLILWDVADKSMRREIAIPANVQLRDVVFSRDGRLLAIDLGDNRAIVHEIASGLERHRFTRKGDEIKKEPVQEVRQVFFATSAMQASQTLAFSRDGRRLAMATEGRVVHVWDALTGEDLGKRAGHQGEIGAVAFSPDGELLATGGEDAIGLIWDMAALKSIKNPVVELNQGDLETRWNALYAADGAGAFTAIAGLINAPNATVPFLDKLLKIPEDVNADVIDRLIVDLDARRFPTRKKAQEDLEKIGAKAVPALKKALDRQASEEIKKRAQELLDKLQGATRTPPQLQASRAIEVLERIGTTEAKAVLERLSKGPAWALEAIESRAALERLR